MGKRHKTVPEKSSETIKCLNCGTEFHSKFCPECGQDAQTGRYTTRVIYQNIVTALKGSGILFTLKNLFTRPGAMVVDMLNGKRRRYLSPFPALFFVLTIYLLIASFTGSREDTPAVWNLEEEQSFDVKKATDAVFVVFYSARDFLGRNYTLSILLTLPFWTFSARLCYGKENRKRYYRSEYTVAVVYSLVMVIIYRCVMSLAHPLSKEVLSCLEMLLPFFVIVAFVCCFRKMMGFGLVNMVVRSIFVSILYYIMLFTLILALCFCVYAATYAMYHAN